MRAVDALLLTSASISDIVKVFAIAVCHINALTLLWFSDLYKKFGPHGRVWQYFCNIFCVCIAFITFNNYRYYE